MSDQLNASQLNVNLKAQDLSFKTTAELTPLNDDVWLGQGEAKNAASFGLSLFKPGFNVLVLGDSGSGRKSLTWRLIEAVSKTRAKPKDFVLLYHFETPEKPLPLYLNAGHGVQLRVAMDAFIRKLLKVMPGLLGELSAPVKDEDKKDGKPKKLDEERRKSIEQFFIDQFAVLIGIVKGEGQTEPNADVLQFEAYLAALMRDAFENIEIFSQASVSNSDNEGMLESFLGRYRVNVMVDNTRYAKHPDLGSPVIFDEDPSFSSLFGGFEASDNNSTSPDFMRLRAGNILRAHGGTLMLYLRDINGDAQSGNQILEKLHRFLRNGSLQIEESSGAASQNTGGHFAPEALPADVKIVLIATREEYYGLQDELPEFARYFQVKVDFADSMPASQEAYLNLAKLVARFVQLHDLKDFSVDAVLALIRFMHRQIDDQVRTGTQFSALERLVLESAVIASQNKAKLVEAQHVQQALNGRFDRHHSPERQLLESIVDGEVMINVTGEHVGQINALTHIDLGDMSFGSPVRISARCYAGGEGVINIDREVAMTGPNHDKGLMILRSWLSASFSKLTPLSLTASLVFEQEYHGVEGDSASCAELYALLSALSGVPIKQGIAVTGAMNQHGEVMAIGGLNEKIEGYFRICKAIGLDGKQGVIIPKRNLAHMLLDHEVVAAVKAGQFHIYAVNNVFEGIELLTGVQAGTPSDGRYPENSVLGKAEHHLETFRKAFQHNQPIQLNTR
jgi:predicted ATP-dependent protease